MASSSFTMQIYVHTCNFPNKELLKKETRLLGRVLAFLMPSKGLDFQGNVLVSFRLIGDLFLFWNSSGLD